MSENNVQRKTTEKREQHGLIIEMWDSMMES